MSHRAVAGLIVALVVGSGQSMQAQPAAVEVSLVSVSPGAPTGDGDWCIGAEQTVLTAHVVALASQSEVTQGTIVWQVCQRTEKGFLPGLPKEDCDGRGSARWGGAVISDLSFDSTPSLATDPPAPVQGFRLQYRPAAGSGLKRATSQPFNLDHTCSP
jgi:hypothetical protein